MTKIILSYLVVFGGWVFAILFCILYAIKYDKLRDTEDSIELHSDFLDEAVEQKREMANTLRLKCLELDNLKKRVKKLIKKCDEENSVHFN